MSIAATVLITGASSGIGYELARLFAFHKHNLILVARNTEKLMELAENLSIEHNINVTVIGKDLCQAGAVQDVFNTVKSMQLQVDILVNNAGSGQVGLFHEIEMDKDLEILQININVLTEMTKLFSREMIKRKKGRILNVASTGAFSPGPFIAVYYAAKAYVLSFSEALYRELKPYNVSVTTLCPGATKTNFAKLAGKRDMPGAMEAKEVAEVAYKAVMKGKRIVVPGLANKILVRLPKNLVSGLNFKSQQRLALGKEDFKE
jgi:short-subunit dehydrogenase